MAGKRLNLYKCIAMIVDESKSVLLDSTTFNTMTSVVTEYLFAASRIEATNIFENRYKNNVHLTVSEVNISPGLIIYKNRHNYNIEDNELTLSVERSDNK